MFGLVSKKHLAKVIEAFHEQWAAKVGKGSSIADGAATAYEEMAYHFFGKEKERELRERKLTSMKTGMLQSKD